MFVEEAIQNITETQDFSHSSPTEQVTTLFISKQQIQFDCSKRPCVLLYWIEFRCPSECPPPTTIRYFLPFTDETQTALFKDPVRTAL